MAAQKKSWLIQVKCALGPMHALLRHLNISLVTWCSSWARGSRGFQSVEAINVTRIIFRCDASLSIGSGHVIRCRTLARAVQKRGAEVLFLCRRQSGDLIALLEKEFRVLILPEKALSLCCGLTGRRLYEAWLGCSQTQDAEDCIAALRAAGVNYCDWLLVDHYGIDASCKQKSKAA